MGEKQEDSPIETLLKAFGPLIEPLGAIFKIYADANAVALKLVAAHKAGEGVTLSAEEVTSVVRIMAAKK